jgi:hypothetical protein
MGRGGATLGLGGWPPPKPKVFPKKKKKILKHEKEIKILPLNF